VKDATKKTIHRAFLIEGRQEPLTLLGGEIEPFTGGANSLISGDISSASIDTPGKVLVGLDLEAHGLFC